MFCEYACGRWECVFGIQASQQTTLFHARSKGKGKAKGEAVKSGVPKHPCTLYPKTSFYGESLDRYNTPFDPHHTTKEPANFASFTQKIPLLSLLSYIDTTCQHLPTFTLSSLTVHRFLIAGVCAGSKAQCDVFCTNAHYAKVGGIKTGELNALEREFVEVTQWDLCVSAQSSLLVWGNTS